MTKLVAVDVLPLGMAAFEAALEVIRKAEPTLSANRESMLRLEAHVVAMWLVMAQRADARFEGEVQRAKQSIVRQLEAGKKGPTA
jgi:hypothetical protein